MSNEKADETMAPQSSLEQTLKRCRPEVVQAALQYQKTKDGKLLPTIVVGVLERYVEPEKRPILQSSNLDDIKLQADLGMDSLVMVEVVMTLEEILGQQIPDTELRGLYTIGDTMAYLNAKTSGAELPTPPDRLVAEMVTMLLNNQVALVCDVVLRENRAEALYCGSEAPNASTLLKAGEQLAYIWGQRRNETLTLNPKSSGQTVNVEATVPVQLRADKNDNGWQLFYNQTGKPLAQLGTL